MGGDDLVAGGGEGGGARTRKKNRNNISPHDFQSKLMIAAGIGDNRREASARAEQVDKNLR